MPKKSRIAKHELQIDLIHFLKGNGPTSPKFLCQKFQISQPSLFRIISLIKDKILIIGKGKETKYSLRRKLENTITPIPIYEILENGTSRKLGLLHAIEPEQYCLEKCVDNLKKTVYRDLPYFLNDMRPTGFLGRLIPAQHKDLNLPTNISSWRSEHCLTYFANREWNAIGNLILGDNSFQLYLENSISIKNIIRSNEKKEKYSQLANDMLSYVGDGSSPGGEQPKFTTMLMPELKYVLVKFSPPINTEIGQRVADLMICEHIVHKILNKHLINSSQSEIIIHENRVFLEIERFDRLKDNGRKGLISLGSLDAEFSGKLENWSNTALALMQQKIISKDDLEKIQWLELFGHFIANNDMHLYNLSFFTCGLKVTGLAPVYDMLPMLFMPRNNQIISVVFNPLLPIPGVAKIWSSAINVACEFWDEVQKDFGISKVFKIIALDCMHKVTELKKLSPLLPMV